MRVEKDELERLVEEKARASVQGESSLVQQKETSFEGMKDEYFKRQIEKGKDISGIATDFVKAKTTSDIMKNEDGKYDKLHKEFAEEQKETLKQSFVQDKVEQQAKTLNAKQQKAEAFYVSFRPILEFDFSPLIHKVTKDDKEPKTYKDRSYGIPLMVLMLMLFVVPYCTFSMVLALCNGINAVFEAIATFGKVARAIATTIFVLLLMALIIYCALLGIDALFGTNLIASVKL